MVNYRSYIEEQVSSRRNRLQELNREKVTVSAELRAFEDMLHHLEQAEHKPSPARSEKVASNQTAFQMSDHWRAILRELEQEGGSFAAADMVRVGKSVGRVFTTANVRSQIAFYVKRKMFRKVRKGRYNFTDEGREAVRNSEGPDAGTSKPSNGSGKPDGVPGLAGEAATSPNESRTAQKGIFD